MIRNAGRVVLDVLFPPRCVGCGEWDAGFLCVDCVSVAPKADGARCDVCWNVVSGMCQDCAQFPRAYTASRSTFMYHEAAETAVRRLKFDGVSALAEPMAGEMVKTLEAWGPSVDVMVPVPLGSRRKRLRGYNQSELLARSIGGAAGIPVATKLVRRVRDTKPQTDQPDRAARRINVRDAFASTGAAVPASVLLIDDVVTTGATLDACARALMQGGAKSVVCLTFARAD